MRDSLPYGRDPFKIHGPAIISFSGGRTSAYMLRRILDSGLEPDVHVVFADTGKERSETYEFVRECERRWEVKVNRVGRPGGFEALIVEKQALPHVRARWCTQYLKVYPIRDFGRGLGWSEWSAVIGIRADEPRRLAKMRGRPNDAGEEERVYPLAEAGIGLETITEFWRQQPFDLALRPWEGNCDLCFLKGQHKRIRIMRDRPDLAQWWIDQEARGSWKFRSAPRPTYAQLFAVSQLPILFDPDEEEELTDCICGD